MSITNKKNSVEECLRAILANSLDVERVEEYANQALDMLGKVQRETEPEKRYFVRAKTNHFLFANNQGVLMEFCNWEAGLIPAFTLKELSELGDGAFLADSGYTYQQTRRPTIGIADEFVDDDGRAWYKPKTIELVEVIE